MEPISNAVEQRTIPFRFPKPNQLSPPILTMENTATGYTGMTVLTGLNLQINPDDRIALLGANGNGKSTFLKLLSGRILPTNGKMSRPNNLRIGYFAQHQTEELNSSETPYQALSRSVHNGSNETIRGQLARFGFESIDVDTKISSLSGGEKSRLLFCLMSASSPQLLLLDEPLASIDAPSRGFIIQKLKMISDEMRIPVLYVSHSLSEVIAIADHVLVLSEGSVAAEGSPNILLGHPDVKKLSDFHSFENFLEGIVVSKDSENYMTTVSVGDANLLVSHTDSSIGSEIILSIRASDVILSGEIPLPLSARNVVKAIVSEVHFSENAVLVECDFGEKILVEITRQAQQQLGVSKTSSIYLIVKASSVMVLDK